MAIRPRRALRPRRQRRKISRRRGRLSRLRAGGDDPWRLWLRKGVPRRALLARIPDPAHRPDQPAADPEFHRRKSARPAEVVLMMRTPQPSFRAARSSRATPESVTAGRGYGLRARATRRVPE